TYAYIFNIVLISLFFMPYYNGFEVAKRDILPKFEKMSEEDDDYYSYRFYLIERNYIDRKIIEKKEEENNVKVVKRYRKYDDTSLKEYNIANYSKILIVNEYSDLSKEKIEKNKVIIERFLNNELDNSKSKLIPLSVEIEKKSNGKY
ncbi:hypothetical protein, partial [Oceanivirga salmonicida]